MTRTQAEVAANITPAFNVRNGLSADSAFRVIEEARGRQVPDTAEQRQWVERYSSRFGSVGK